jgi:cytochrome c biogenesis protein CcdA
MRTWLLGRVALLVAALVVSVLGSSAVLPATAGAAPADEPVVVEFFYCDGCPYCHQQAEHMADWERRFPTVEVRRYEVWRDPENLAALTRVAEAHGVRSDAVPMTFIAGRVWTGFDPAMGREMDAWLDSLVGAAPTAQPATSAREALDLPFIGEVHLGQRSLFAATALIALVDGFNPCSLWVLTVLLAVALRTGSRRDLILVGGTFLAITAAVYGLFIIGLFSAFTAVGMRDEIRIGVALIALVFAAVNLKDAFAFRRGPSLTIPDRFKPDIIRRARGVVRSGGSTAVLMGSTALLALGVSVIELPCTAGFPMLWTAMVSGQEVTTAGFTALLGVYLGVYLADEVAVFLVVAVTLRATRLQQHHGQALKLVGGMLMLALAATLLLRPELMEDPVSAVTVVGGAIVVGVLVEAVRRRRSAGSGGGGPSPPTSSGPRTEERRNAVGAP